MKRISTAMLCVALCILLLSGCGIVSRALSAFRHALRGTPEPAQQFDQHTSAPDVSADFFQTTAPEETAAPEATDEVPKTPKPSRTAVPEPSATAPKLSGNRSDIPSDELMEHFRQVVFGSAGDQIAMKWADPIVVSVTGNYDEHDSELLTDIFDTFNDYDGFPSIVYAEAAGKDAEVSMQVKFVTADALASAEPKWSGKSPCYAHYWYDDNNEIYKSAIYIVPEMEDNRTNQDCDIAWGVFYTMGFFNNSDLYYDSLFNPDYYDEALGSSYKGPCAADWYIVSMLYSKAVKPGMTFQQAEAVLSN